MLSCPRMGPLSTGLFCGDELTDGSELAAGVGVGGGHLRSIARAGRLWKLTSPMRLECPLGTRRGAAHADGGLQSEERQGLDADVRRIVRRRKTLVQRIFE
jgi:hypothetical protein